MLAARAVALMITAGLAVAWLTTAYDAEPAVAALSENVAADEVYEVHYVDTVDGAVIRVEVLIQ